MLMKTIRLFYATTFALAAGLLLSTELKAQTLYAIEEYTPTVYMIAVGETLEEYDPEAARDEIINAYIDTSREGFQQAHNPQFIFATRNNRFSLALGGMVNLRTSYDFLGAVNNIDFVTYDIPMSKSYANRQHVMMDATTSRLFMKAIINSRMLGRITVFTDMDFRGGNDFSYIPRLRSAYIQFKGLTIGRDVTTFCDLMASPRTVDFQGPNAYNFEFNEMIRYEIDFARDHLRFGIAAEMPNVDATYGEYLSPIPQRVPDGIAYLQVAWGKDRNSHLRASGVVRDMYLHNNSYGKNTTELGWGVQLSGHISATEWLDIYMNGVYGKGITPYIQDLAGSSYDFIYNPAKPDEVHTLPMWGWQAAAQINFIPNVLWAAGGYSDVRLDADDLKLASESYRRGQYIFGNLFCNVTPNLTLALEYLRGMRENMDHNKRSANRISLMAQYNF